jgi:integrase
LGKTQQEVSIAQAKARGSDLLTFTIEDPCSRLQGIFDRKEVCHFQIRSLTPQQAPGNALACAVQRLLPECPKHLRRVVECAIHTGMWKSEILGLRWDQIKRGHIYLEADDTKTREARQVPINDDLQALLKEIRAEQPVGTKHVFMFRRGEHRIKTGKGCRVLSPITGCIQDVKSSFQGAVRRAGIHDFKFHDLRHTFASQLIMKGGSLKEVQEILGHKSMTMTMRYAHLSQEKKKEAVNLLNGLTSGVSEVKKGPQVSVPMCHKSVTFNITTS